MLYIVYFRIILYASHRLIVNFAEVRYVQSGVYVNRRYISTIPYFDHFNDAGGEKSTCII